jgi:hypothetical protein
MKQSKLFLMTIALMLFCGLSAARVLACHDASSAPNESRAACQVNLKVIDGDSGSQMRCYSINGDQYLTCYHASENALAQDSNSENINQPVSLSPQVSQSVAANDASTLPVDLLMMLLIIGLHFVVGLVHTWFRERKKSK